jgi:hypothetical protein
MYSHPMADMPLAFIASATDTISAALQMSWFGSG